MEQKTIESISDKKLRTIKRDNGTFYMQPVFLLGNG